MSQVGTGSVTQAPQPLGEKALSLLGRVEAVRSSLRVIEDRLHGTSEEAQSARPTPLTLHDVIDAAHSALFDIEAYLNKIHQSIGEAMPIPDGPKNPGQSAPSSSRLR